jgi:molybdate transport system regulatory protein
MNQLNAVIQSMETEENISIIVAAAAGKEWYALVIDNIDTAPHLKPGSAVALVFKETAVSLAKGVSGQLSIRNRLAGTVSRIKIGTTLSEVGLHCDGFSLTSIITTNAVQELNLQEGDVVEALIKTTDISLMPQSA